MTNATYPRWPAPSPAGVAPGGRGREPARCERTRSSRGGPGLRPHPCARPGSRLPATVPRSAASGRALLAGGESVPPLPGPKSRPLPPRPQAARRGELRLTRSHLSHGARHELLAAHPAGAQAHGLRRRSLQRETEPFGHATVEGQLGRTAIKKTEELLALGLGLHHEQAVGRPEERCLNPSLVRKRCERP
jgi:hypothetical protein